MKYRKIGSLNLEVSALGFGCMRFPSRGMLRGVDWDKSIELIRYGIDKGINYFDTGWPYHLGASEIIIGKALQAGYRKRVFLVTKLPMFMISKTEDFDKYLNQQLKRLQTDYLDAYFFHALNRNQFLKLEKFNLVNSLCKYCMPCPAGVNIPENFAVLNNFAFKGNRGFWDIVIKRRYRKLAKSKKKANKEHPNGNV